MTAAPPWRARARQLVREGSGAPPRRPRKDRPAARYRFNLRLAGRLRELPRLEARA
jgi:hypothetical protein